MPVSSEEFEVSREALLVMVVKNCQVSMPSYNSQQFPPKVRYLVSNVCICVRVLVFELGLCIQLILLWCERYERVDSKDTSMRELIPKIRVSNIKIDLSDTSDR